ncbi:MAG: tetratricopeptide repeat protein [Deltaproteobacteria bacterium]|nr:tetratricopeptide repeat protein [Deltaproteobacteria bacterium]
MALKEKLLDRAQKYILKGYLDKAIAEYRSAADVDPRDISIRLRIGDLYVKTNRKDEAIKEYTEVAKANAQRGFYLKAIAVYKQVLKLDDSILDIHYKLAELYTKQRLIADAISSYSYIVSTFEKKGKTSEVMELLKKMLDIDPDNIGIRLKLADLFQKLSFEKDALEEYALIFGKLMEQGKFDKAEKIFLSLHNSKPSEPVVLKGLSELYKKKGDEVKFLNFARPLLKAYRDSHDIGNAKAVCLSILDARPDDAEALDFMRGISQPPPPAAPMWDASVAPAEAAGEGKAALIESPEDKAQEAGVPPVEEKAPAQAFVEGEKPVDGPLISWPEEEIQVTLEGFEEGAEPAPYPAVAAEEAFKDEEEFEVNEPITREASVPPEDAVVEAAVPAPIDENPAVEDISVEAAAVEPALPGADVPSEVPEPVEAAPEEDVEIEIDLGPLGEDELKPVLGLTVAETVPEAVEEPVAEAAAPVEEEPAPVEEEPTEVEVPLEVEAETVPEAVEEPAAEEAAPVEEPAPVEEEPVEVEVLLEAAAETVPEAVEEIAAEETPVEIESELSGTVEEVIEKVLGDEPEAQAGMEEPFAAEAEDGASVQQAAETVETIESPEVQDELSNAIEELKEKIESDDMILEPDNVKVEEPASGSESEYIDLSAELGMEEALEDLAGTWSKGEGESNDAFDEFKSAIGTQLSKEDTETHYNLGIAYMEMELYDEAGKEFKIALKDPRLEGDCYARLGLCAMAESRPDEAIVYYLKGLKVEGKTEEERNGMMYELALAYEAAGDTDEAFQLFTSIHDLDPDFREVEKKLSAFDRERPYIPLDDGLMEVELL